jgi:hypothetical protein
VQQVFVRTAVLIFALLVYGCIAMLTVRGEYPTTASALALGLSDAAFIWRNFSLNWIFLLSSLPTLYRDTIFGTITLGLVVLVFAEICYLRKVAGLR